jgi:hypothetical protein
LVNSKGDRGSSENTAIDTPWGKTFGPNVPAEITAIAADRALAVYLETLAAGLAESLSAA